MNVIGCLTTGVPDTDMRDSAHCCCWLQYACCDTHLLMRQQQAAAELQLIQGSSYCSFPAKCKTCCQINAALLWYTMLAVLPGSCCSECLVSEQGASKLRSHTIGLCIQNHLRTRRACWRRSNRPAEVQPGRVKFRWVCCPLRATTT